MLPGICAMHTSTSSLLIFIQTLFSVKLFFGPNLKKYAYASAQLPSSTRGSGRAIKNNTLNGRLSGKLIRTGLVLSGKMFCL